MCRGAISSGAVDPLAVRSSSICSTSCACGSVAARAGCATRAPPAVTAATRIVFVRVLIDSRKAGTSSRTAQAGSAVEATRAEQLPSPRREPGGLDRAEHGEVQIRGRRVERYDDPVRERQYGRGIDGAMKPLPGAPELAHRGVVAREGQRHEDRECEPPREQPGLESFGEDPR